MDTVIQLVNRANQRGGRMLSMVDLIERETITVERAAWLVGHIQHGSSFLVGARPGGAGKTVVMCALLAMLPNDETINLTAPGTDWENSTPGQCVLAYEISPGHYDAYVWDDELRRMTELGVNGCRLVTNLHADTLEEARVQIVDENRVSMDGFNSFSIFIPLELGGLLSGRTPVVGAISACQNGTWVNEENVPPPPEHETIAAFLSNCLDKGIKTVEDVRTTWLKAAEA